jgi:hypothetical protein
MSLFTKIRRQWRVALVSLLAANLVFIALLSLQITVTSRVLKRPATEQFLFVAKEIAEAKQTETQYLDLIYRSMADLNTRLDRLEKQLASQTK